MTELNGLRNTLHISCGVYESLSFLDNCHCKKVNIFIIPLQKALDYLKI